MKYQNKLPHNNIFLFSNFLQQRGQMIKYQPPVKFSRQQVCRKNILTQNNFSRNLIDVKKPLNTLVLLTPFLFRNKFS